MTKRITAIIISIVLAVGAPVPVLAAHSPDSSRHSNSSDDDDVFDVEEHGTRDRNVIWEGLCVGASLDISQRSQESCARQVEEADDDKARDHRDDRKDRHHDKDRHKERERDHDKDMRKDRDMDPGEDRDRSRDRDSERDRDEAVEPAGYAALGDSVAAGLGLGSVIGPDERCGRTLGAYPYLVADDENFETVNHLACTGATMGDLFTEQGISGPNIEPQLAGAFAEGTPELMTITAGANDIRWDFFLRKCYAGTCGTATDETVVNSLLAALEIKMQFLFLDIERRSSGSLPETIMTGYYNPLSEGCSEIEPRLTPDEIAWLGEQTDNLNQLLENSSARHDFVTFVPIDFSGHDVCSDDPWVQGLGDPAPFHPTTEGQESIARAIT